MSLGLYLHIPYCFSKCRYCDFYSHPGERGVPDAYVEALVRELDRFAPERPLQPDTLYFGGGTPALLRPDQVHRLIKAAAPLPGAEITLEAKGGIVGTPTIYNADTGAYLRITGDILEGDKITITTRHGHRTVTLTRNGVSTPIMNRWVSGSDWLELPTGESHFYLTAMKGLKYLIVTFRHTDVYLGV